MQSRTARSLLTISLFLGLRSVAFAESIGAKVETLCTGVETLDTAPDRPLKFGLETNLLLLLTKPFISKDRQEAIFEKWQFSSKENELMAKISSRARWSDGEAVTALEAATGIIAGLKNRSLSKVLKLKGHESLPSTAEILSNPRRYFNTIADDMFTIKFDSSIENLQGVIVDALSANSRVNRVWPIRIKNSKISSDIVSKNRIEWNKNQPEIIVSEKLKIKPVHGEDCQVAEHYLSSSLFEQDENNFEKNLSPQQQAVFAIINPNTERTKTVKQRMELTESIKLKLNDIHDQEFENTHFLFQRGEPGFSETSKSFFYRNPDSQSSNSTDQYLIQPWTQVPKNWKIRSLLENQEKNKNQFVFTNPNDSSAALRLVVEPVGSKGNQVSLQSGSTFNRIEQYQKEYPKTYQSLLKIRKHSTSTFPSKTETLTEFADAANQEVSIIPLIRFRIAVLSKKKSSGVLVWTHEGELIFIERKQK